MIPVTKPFLPPLAEYQKYLNGIWQRNWLTNNGPLVNELELNLKEYLKVPNLLFLTNGTIALQIAIKALDLKGEIITTPFSYVATTSSIVWEGCTPVYVDIDEHTLNLDPKKIESAITEKTSAILATHVYGNPCDIEAIQQIANRYGLKVIYDGAHAFGSDYKGKSIFNYGDVTTASFHATKLFHTVEGGAIFSQNADLIKQMAFKRNFGHDGYVDFAGVGINGKNSEFHAAMGIINLRYIEGILERRKALSYYYDDKLTHLQHQKIRLQANSKFNFAYYPIIFETEEKLVKSVELLNKNMIFPRRYFYPSLSTISYIKCSKMPISESISKRILCLPLYFDLSEAEVDLVVRILLRAQNN